MWLQHSRPLLLPQLPRNPALALPHGFLPLPLGLHTPVFAGLASPCSGGACPAYCWMFLACSWLHDFCLLSACAQDFPAKNICPFPALVLPFIGFKWYQVKLKCFNWAKQKWWWNEAMGMQGKTDCVFATDTRGQCFVFYSPWLLQDASQLTHISAQAFMAALNDDFWLLVTFSLSPSLLSFYPPATISWLIFHLEAVLHLPRPCLLDVSLLLLFPPAQNLSPFSHISQKLRPPLCRDKL